MDLREMRERAARHETRRGWSTDYPNHPMVDFTFRLKSSVRSALEAFSDAKPYRLQRRYRRTRDASALMNAIRQLYRDLSEAYDIPCPTVVHDGPWEGPSTGSSYVIREHTVVLTGQLSIITTLHEYAHARGYGETAAVWWSVNAFRLVYPHSFAKLGPMAGSPHALRRVPEHDYRTPGEAETFWRDFYAQRRGEPWTLGAALRRSAGRPSAAQLQSQRNAARISWAIANTASTATAPSSRPVVDAGVERFRNLDLSDDEPETTTLEVETEDDPGVARFRNLDLGDDEGDD